MNETVLKIILIYLLVVNLVGFVMMGVDKNRARKQAWRISEKALFLVSLIGGSLGTWTGMYAFRHKTKHWYFVVCMPLIFFSHIALAVYLMWKFGLFPFK